MAFDPKCLFDKDTFSDIEISNGEDLHIKCHKTILCSASEYFKKLCGPGGRFVEKNAARIVLKGDPPHALRAVLAGIYGFDYSLSYGDNDPCHHLDVVATARKYLLPEIEGAAVTAFCNAVARVSEVEEIQRVLEHSSRSENQHESIDKALGDLTVEHAEQIIAEPGLRALVASSDLFWRYIGKQLSIAENLETCELYKCTWCKHVILAPSYMECIRCGKKTYQKIAVWVEVFRDLPQED